MVHIEFATSQSLNVNEVLHTLILNLKCHVKARLFRQRIILVFHFCCSLVVLSLFFSSVFDCKSTVVGQGAAQLKFILMFQIRKLSTKFELDISNECFPLQINNEIHLD